MEAVRPRGHHHPQAVQGHHHSQAAQEHHLLRVARALRLHLPQLARDRRFMDSAVGHHGPGRLHALLGRAKSPMLITVRASILVDVGWSRLQYTQTRIGQCLP
ncbi:hypothetical protein FRC19_008678 [Serendipita sp. 401]|nr:hypothetical protein FRC19_008678 [Serendipita sp. 401]KAG9021001.1 hypothetical protein FS842_006868 [Serendipita sp. 407]